MAVLAFSAGNAFCMEAEQFYSVLEKLVKQSRQSSAVCEKYVKELNKQSSRLDLVFQDKEQALSVLSKIEKYPRTPDSAARTWQLVTEDLPTDLNYRRFEKLILKLQDSCEPGLVFFNIRKIISSMNELNFSADEKLRARKIFLGFVDKETSASCNTSTLITCILIIDKMNNAGMLGDKQKIAEITDMLRTDHKNVNHKARRANTDYETLNIETVGNESRRIKFRELLSILK
jgi:hypothetical protein